jgi:hypothetical protein
MGVDQHQKYVFSTITTCGAVASLCVCPDGTKFETPQQLVLALAAAHRASQG